MSLKIILASSSPRRIELLGAVGLKIQVKKPDADETPLSGEGPRALVRRLARAKAQSVATGALPGSVVIAADTIVVSPQGRILGKPSNAFDAVRMLRSLSGRTHTVLTGYCVIRAGGKPSERVARVISSRVKMRAIGAAEIRRYVATGEPMDKAGSYAAQGVGMSLIEEIRGSYTNVVGLPMAQLLSDLEKKFGLSFLSWNSSE